MLQYSHWSIEVPYELTWLAIMAVPNGLRKLFKLNVEAVALLARELDFWVPFMTMCGFAIFVGASIIRA